MSMKLVPPLLAVAFFLVFSLVEYEFPVLKRAFAVFGNSNPGVALKLAQQWGGTTVILCSVGLTKGSALGVGTCISSFTMAVITSVGAMVTSSTHSGSAKLPQ